MHKINNDDDDDDDANFFDSLFLSPNQAFLVWVNNVIINSSDLDDSEVRSYA